MPISIAQVYRAYPDSDLLPFEISDEVTLADIEALASRGALGDTLFLFLCRELCNQDEELDLAEVVERCDRAISDIRAVSHALAASILFPQDAATAPPEPNST